jgi:DNA-binding FadR family transcriptional regulator
VRAQRSLAVNGHTSLRRGLHGRVVDDLGRRIVGGEWERGAQLPNEDDLASELGVSRTVVREAVKVLQAKGLVEVRPKTGTRVRSRRSWHLLDADIVSWQFADILRGEDLRELYELRATVEIAAARLAAERCTTEQLAEIDAHRRRIESAAEEPLAFRAAELDFHAAIVEAAHNSLLSHVGAVIRVALETVAEPVVADHGGNGRALSLRAALTTAIRVGDASGSEAAMRSLVDLAWQRSVPDNRKSGDE